SGWWRSSQKKPPPASSSATASVLKSISLLPRAWLTRQTVRPSRDDGGARPSVVPTSLAAEPSGTRGGALAIGPAAPRPQAEHDARDDSEQPAENGAGEDDPNERGGAAADDPAQLHLPRVGDDERDHDDEERDERERPRVEPGAMAVPAKTHGARLDRLHRRRRSGWGR